jgi:Lrp/AsnC family leucine-responsive transcriptional regulator
MTVLLWARTLAEWRTGSPSPSRPIAKIAEEIPEIVECYRITGDDCFYFTAHLRTVDQLEPILDRFAPYGRTTTSLVHAAAVPRRPLPLDPGQTPRS